MKRKRTKEWNRHYAASYYKRHPDRVKAKNKRYASAHKEKFSFLSKQKSHRRRSLLSNGSHTYGEWENLKAQYNYTCPCCGKSEPEIKLTEDHIIPLSKGGSNNVENIQPLCHSCNNKKFTKVIKYVRS